MYMAIWVIRICLASYIGLTAYFSLELSFKEVLKCLHNKLWRFVTIEKGFGAKEERWVVRVSVELNILKNLLEEIDI